MSGPKVVRIVTREEVLALCTAELARLDAALGDWTRAGLRSDCVFEEDIAAAAARRKELAGLLAADRFMDFQKAAGQEIAYLAADLQVRLAKVAEEKAAARAFARRQCEAARALLNALRTKAEPLAEDLAARLEAVTAGASDPAAMATGFAALSNAGDDGAAERKRLAELHRTEDTGPSLAEWMRGQPLPVDEARLLKVDRRLAELQLVASLPPALLSAREAVENESQGRRRALLLDSLELDVGGLVAAAKARAALASELNLVLAGLAALAPKRHAELDARRAKLASDAGFAALLSEAKAEADEAMKAIAANARREAILSALLGLGYEVDEGMETAWATEGQLVLRNAARPDYGVEITGTAEVERLQMRAVAFEDGDAASADAFRDRDAETIWCTEVGALRQQLAQAGTDLDIIKARAIGEVPLKRVKGRKAEERRRSARAPKSRTLG